MPKFLDPSSYYVKNSFSEVPGEEFILEGGFEKVKAAIEKAKAASKKMASGIPTSTEPRHVGPHPSFVKVAQPFITEQKLREYMANTGVTEAKEDSMRLQGVSWIDGVRKKLLLPEKTFHTAVVYYHKFRLCHADNEYNFIDAAAAALFLACKVEDTLKRSREILCAAHNLRLSATAEQASQDDPMFEIPSKTVIGLERLILEASGFDFRSRHPNRLVIKFAKYNGFEDAPFGRIASNMCIDLYRTFIPLKQTTPVMALACVVLTAKLLGQEAASLDDIKIYKQLSITPEEVMETVLDLLDLYTHHRAATTVGQNYTIETFITVRIHFNQKASAANFPRYIGWIEKPQNGQANGAGGKAINGTKGKQPSQSPISPRDPLGAESPAKPGYKDGTVRFMLDPQRARDEQKIVDRFFKLEEVEEVEYERKK